MNTNRTVRINASLLSLSLMIIARWVKLSFIVGSKGVLFSAAQMVTPLTGFYGGWRMSGLAFVIHVLMHCVIKSAIIPTVLVYHIPSFCASLFLSTPFRLRIIMPLGCIILFLLHPVGWLSSWYALFWLLPVLVSLLPNLPFFMQALGATFTAHAAGTLVYLYLGNITSCEQFYMLVPLVFVERLLFALGMTLVYYGVNFIAQRSFIKLPVVSRA